MSENALRHQESQLLSASSASEWQDVTRAMLIGLGWEGTDNQFKHMTSGGNAIVVFNDFRAAMRQLGYIGKIVAPSEWDKVHLPALLLNSNGRPLIVTSGQDFKSVNQSKAQLWSFASLKKDAANENLADGRSALFRFRPLINQIVFFSLIVGVLSLAPTFYNMTIYDQVIPSGSHYSLGMLAIGALLALSAEVAMRHMRGKALGFFGARVDHYVSCSVFERLLFLPPVYTERASVSSQLARLRDFESVREFFTGPMAGLFFEMPLVAIYLGAMAIMGGWLITVPLALLVVYSGLLFGLNAKFKRHSQESAAASSQKNEFVLETVTKLRDIRLNGLEQTWQKRYQLLSRRVALSHFKASFAAQGLETASYVLMNIGAMATLALGVFRVIDKKLMTGELIGSMMLLWRILTPMQIACSSITRLRQLNTSTRQVQRLLATSPESSPYTVTTLLQLDGRITFHRVSLRYTPDSEPALLGVSFDIKPGQVIAVRGNNGSGKSSILKLILGMYLPQSGNVRLDGIDIRQLDPIGLRQSIAYVPQSVDFFPGTVRDNLLFSNQNATEEECVEALHTACAWEEVNRLSQGLDTIIAGDDAAPISFVLKQRINLARAYLRPASIMLFDEASHSLGRENDIAFAQVINRLRGRATIIMVTHREDHMMLCDALLVLDKGELTHAGPPAQILTVLKGRAA